MVSQEYETDVNKERAIAGNSAIMKCDITSFIADFVTVTGWLEESQDIEYFPSDNFGTMVNHFRMIKIHRLSYLAICRPSSLPLKTCLKKFLWGLQILK